MTPHPHHPPPQVTQNSSQKLLHVPLHFALTDRLTWCAQPAFVSWLRHYQEPLVFSPTIEESDHTYTVNVHSPKRWHSAFLIRKTPLWVLQCGCYVVDRWEKITSAFLIKKTLLPYKEDAYKTLLPHKEKQLKYWAMRARLSKTHQKIYQV